MKNEVNQELLCIGKILIDTLSEQVKEKVHDIDLKKLLSKKNEDEILSLWSSQLAEIGFLPKGYAGLTDEF